MELHDVITHSSVRVNIKYVIIILVTRCHSTVQCTDTVYCTFVRQLRQSSHCRMCVYCVRKSASLFTCTRTARASLSLTFNYNRYKHFMSSTSPEIQSSRCVPQFFIDPKIRHNHFSNNDSQ